MAPTGLDPPAIPDKQCCWPRELAVHPRQVRTPYAYTGKSALQYLPEEKPNLEYTTQKLPKRICIGKQQMQYRGHLGSDILYRETLNLFRVTASQQPTKRICIGKL